jgi:hypothetical protein
VFLRPFSFCFGYRFVSNFFSPPRNVGRPLVAPAA